MTRVNGTELEFELCGDFTDSLDYDPREDPPLPPAVTLTAADIGACQAYLESRPAEVTMSVADRQARAQRDFEAMCQTEAQRDFAEALAVMQMHTASTR